MAINIGIVGLPNVGKSTLFNALSAAGAESANFPFCTIEPNVGVVPVPDARLDALAAIYKSKRTIPTALEFVDIAGLVRGASKGEGLGNQFLGHIRAVDALAQVVRCFEDDDVLHVEGTVDPVRDLETLDTELVLKDLETVTKRLERNTKQTKAQSKAGEQARQEQALLERLSKHLNEIRPARTADLGEAGNVLIRELCLLSAKPMMLIGNVAEHEAATPEKNASFARLKAYGREHDMPVLAISAAIEAELSELAHAERQDYLESMGLNEPGLLKVIAAGYQMLGLVTYLTAGPEEARAWTIRKGMTAPQAAGVIHSDFERGFIRAEIMAANDLIAMKSEAQVKQAGKFRVEGKEYLVSDGDVIHFRFNV